MTDPHRVRLAAYLQEREIDAHITVELEDSVRADWWRAGCMVHDWSTTGSKDTVEGAAAMHVADDHLACSAPADRTFIGVPLYCHLEPDHDGDEHANGGYTWARAKEAEPEDDDYEVTNQPLTATQLIALRVRKHRNVHGWSARELGERCAQAGLPKWERNIVANLENGRRENVSIEEVLVLAQVMSVPPESLYAPLETDDKPADDQPSETDIRIISLEQAVALRSAFGADMTYDRIDKAAVDAARIFADYLKNG